ncbi:MAG: hypothetical protein KIT11_03300 [Fimbriimonadaceae bacterium]|nr:hypothetical protein [Fimbriimonadaceae bacterium]
MAAAMIGGKAYVYLGDIGDNDRKRSSIAIYRVDDPAEMASSTLVPNLTLTLTYPDKPRDCEALLVEPGSGSLFLVTKARDGETGVYYLPSPQKSGSYELKKLGVIPLDTGALGGKYVTAGDISPDRKSVVLRTYSGALVFEPGTVFRDWWREVPKTVAMPVMSQSEAICFTSDGRGLLVTSEGNPCPVFLAKAR